MTTPTTRETPDLSGTRVLHPQDVRAEVLADHHQLAAVVQRHDRSPGCPPRPELASWVVTLLAEHLRSEATLGEPTDQDLRDLVAGVTDPADAREEAAWSRLVDAVRRHLDTPPGGTSA